jgi:5-methyltetrahydrofolate--homocysteine methyltransferase
LDVQHTIGIELTESLAMYPASSECGWSFAHPEINYFGKGKIQQDQLEDYVMRKEMPLEKMERWISPNLD